ncbi:MAG TPA: hypothetical protein PKX90_11845, partial [bacterium]|nr:hypothetical protein [bacterium]
EKVWDTVGGSMWEIQLLLSRFFEEEVEKVCEEYKIKIRNMIIDYATEKNRKLNEQVLIKFVNKCRISKGKFNEEEIEILKDMVHNNIIYYNPVTAEFYPQGRSYEWGIKLYFNK